MVIAAVTGAVLACGVVQLFSWVERHKAHACEWMDGLCWTWWDGAAIPLAVTTALIALMVAYEGLDIETRLALVLPTIALAPFPLTAAQAVGAGWAANLTGAAWACLLALAAWSRYRIPGLSASAALLLASLVVLYR